MNYSFRFALRTKLRKSLMKMRKSSLITRNNMFRYAKVSLFASLTEISLDFSTYWFTNFSRRRLVKVTARELEMTERELEVTVEWLPRVKREIPLSCYNQNWWLIAGSSSALTIFVAERKCGKFWKSLFSLRGKEVCM